MNKTSYMKRILLLAAAAALLLSSCRKELPGHVVFVGIDGWSVAEFIDVDMPFCRSLQERGSWTFNKRTVIPTASGINWESLCTATPPEYHGFTKWYSISASYDQVCATGRDTIPTIFRLFRDAHPDAHMLLTYNWDAIPHIADSTAFDKVLGGECSREGDFLLLEQAAGYFKENRPELSFLYFGAQDELGHEFGWRSDEYRAGLVTLDKLIEGVFTALREADMEDDTVVLITTDHGGWGKAHGGQYVNDVIKTPFFIVGKGVKKGHEILRPINQMGVAATLARVLGIKPLDNWTGFPADEAFE